MIKFAFSETEQSDYFEYVTKCKNRTSRLVEGRRPIWQEMELELIWGAAASLQISCCCLSLVSHM